MAREPYPLQWPDGWTRTAARERGRARFNTSLILASRDVREEVGRSGGFGVVTVDGQGFEVDDIGMRMLVPRELFRAQGFPDRYRIDLGHQGRPLSKTAQVRMAGNSVVPLLAAAIVGANYQRTAARRAA